MSTQQHFRIQKDFFPKASALAKHYQSVFASPLKATGERFCWDYWNVPDQYTHLRTPAWEFFPEKLYSQWHQAIVKWGQENLGCHEITPPWLSCYVDGCKQELHADLPHGPWAFVYSLTAWKTRSFKGGETIILRPDILNYWNSDHVGGKAKGLNRKDVFDTIEPDFNQLLVFDPRHPHGVREVHGTHDVSLGRIVIHGWFVDPKPWVLGGLQKQEDAVAEELNKFVTAFLQKTGKLSNPNGTLTLQLRIGTSGAVRGLKILSSTVKDRGSDVNFQRHLTAASKKIKFPLAKSESKITLPILFSN